MESNSNKIAHSCTLPENHQASTQACVQAKTIEARRATSQHSGSGQASVEYAVVLVGFLALIIALGALHSFLGGWCAHRTRAAKLISRDRAHLLRHDQRCDVRMRFAKDACAKPARSLLFAKGAKRIAARYQSAHERTGDRRSSAFDPCAPDQSAPPDPTRHPALHAHGDGRGRCRRMPRARHRIFARGEYRNRRRLRQASSGQRATAGELPCS